MLKKICLAAVLFLSARAEASFNVMCHLGDSEQFHVWLMLVEHLGTPQERLGLSISNMTVVANDRELLYSGSAMGNPVRVNSQGVFELINKDFFPVRRGGDVMNPRRETVPVRRLTLEADVRVRSELQGFRFQVEPTLPNDGRMLGTATIRVGNRTLTNQRADCYLAIDWETYKRSQTRRTR